jgi:hypothetical protein
LKAAAAEVRRADPRLDVRPRSLPGVRFVLGRRRCDFVSPGRLVGGCPTPPP